MNPDGTGSILKRGMDVFASVTAIVLFAPLLLGVALFIKFRSPGPVFFRQIRIGRGGKEFLLLKFRTMHSDASRMSNASTTRCGDLRIFGGGETIRKFKLDELPQLVNVLAGEMSIIGPRPTVREDYERMTAEQRRRVSVRPGLSGLAQVSGNTSLNWSERIQLDLTYIDNLSLWNDTKIIFRTLAMIISGKADTHPATDDEWS